MNRRHISAAAILAVLLVGIPFTPTSQAGEFPKGSPEFKTSYEAALKAAKETGKPVVVVFSASWCPPCQANKKNVYPSEAVKAYHDKFVWAYLDADDKANGPAMQQFGVNGIPHIEILGKDAKSIGQAVGGTTGEAFAKVLAAALKKAQ